MEQDTTCPYCNERPMGKRKNAATCGDKACQKARNRERMATDEWRERMRENMRAKRAAGMETETMEDRTCEACGRTYRVEARRPQRYCSQKCNAATQDMKELSRKAVELRYGEGYVAQSRQRLQGDELRELWRSQRSPLRAAWEDGDLDDWVEALREKVELDAQGCMVWAGRTQAAGYPTVKVGRRTALVHRMSLEKKLGRGLGSESAHHICANARCVNPDHLQPISMRENLAEMRQRNYFIKRIAELEAEVARLDPSSPLLAGNVPMAG